MGEISVPGIVESFLGTAIFGGLASLLEWGRRRSEKPKGSRPPVKRRGIDRYWLRLAVGILNPKWAPQARSGETVRQTVILVWDILVWRRRITGALALLSALLAIYSFVSTILVALN